MVKLTTAEIDKKLQSLFKGEVTINWKKTGEYKSRKQKLIAVDKKFGEYVADLDKLYRGQRHERYAWLTKEEIDFKVHFIFEGMVSINWKKSKNIKTKKAHLWAVDKEFGEWKVRISELLQGRRHRKRYDSDRKLSKESIDQKVSDKFLGSVKIDWKKTGLLKNTKQKVVAIDSEYGPYTLVLMKLLMGQIHPQKSRDNMADSKRLSVEAINQRIKKMHKGQIYIDWSKSPVYKNNSQIVTAVDSKFGLWKTSVLKLLAGCKHRGHSIEEKKWTVKEINEKIKKVFKGEVKIDWKKTGTFIKNNQKVWAVEKTWGEWEVRLSHLLSGSNHPKKYSSFSRGESEVGNWIRSLGLSIEERNRFFENNNRVWEMDILIPNKKVGIEYHGLYWHSEFRIKKEYHAEKYKFSKDRGLMLFQIYENEWRDKRSIVESLILRKLGIVKQISLKKLEIKEVSRKEGLKFVSENCLKEASSANRFYGLYDKTKLTAVLACQEKYKNIHIVSYCLIKGIRVKEGFQALLAEVVKNKKQGLSLKYFLDLRFEEDNLLKDIGFFEKTIKISWKWTNGKKVFDLTHFKDNMDSRGLLATEYAKEEGFFRIYDAGQMELIREIF